MSDAEVMMRSRIRCHRDHFYAQHAELDPMTYPIGYCPGGCVLNSYELLQIIRGWGSA